MADENRGGAPSKGGKSGGERRDGRPGGGGDGRSGDGRGGGNRGGPRKGGFGKGPAKPVRVETYESLKEVVRGADFRIDKFVVAEKGTNRPVKTEYRLHREGLSGPQPYGRLVDAQAAAVAPLPEPPPAPEPEPEPAELAQEVAADAEVVELVETIAEAPDAVGEPENLTDGASNQSP